MSQSKAKRIRKLATIMGVYDPDAPVEYKEIKHQKTVSFIDMKGLPQIVPVTKIQLINTKNFSLKKMKQHVDEGKIQLPSLKQLHTMAAEKKQESK